MVVAISLLDIWIHFLWCLIMVQIMLCVVSCMWCVVFEASEKILMTVRGVNWSMKLIRRP